MKIRYLPLVLLALIASSARANIINGSFEMPGITPGTVSLSTTVTGWKTTDSNGQIVIHNNDIQGVSAYDGQQFAEVNAGTPSTLYQDLTGISAGSLIGYQFAHRGLLGVDAMRFTVTDLGADGLFGTPDDAVLFTNSFADGNTAWASYAGTGIVALGHTVRFAFNAIASAGGGATSGNFVDGIDAGAGPLGVSPTSVPEPGSLALLGLGAAGLLATRRRSSR